MGFLKTTDCRIVAWGINELYEAFKHKLPRSPNVLLDKRSSEKGIIHPSAYQAQDGDVLVVFSITSYGQIFLEALSRGFKPDRIFNISHFEETLTRVDFITDPSMLNGHPLLCGRVNGSVVISEGLLLISDQHKSFIDIRPEASLRVGNFTLGENADIRVIGHGVLSLGKNSLISKNAMIRCIKKISIGDNCAISWNVTIMDSHGDYELLTNSRDMAEEIIIEDGVWIGHGVSILKGVTIGKGSIIAAHSLVNKNVRPGAIYGGVPAALIREHAAWKRL